MAWVFCLDPRQRARPWTSLNLASRNSPQITKPSPARLFVFLDENEGTLSDDQFGYPMPNDIGRYWWDMPSNRHNQGADFSFADGHVEHWHWSSQ